VAPTLKATLTPFQAQVLPTISPDAEHPGVDHRDQAAGASANAIAVATAPDIDGDGHHVVTVEVLVDESPERTPSCLRVRAARLVVGVRSGGTVSTTRPQASVPAGKYKAAIYIDPAPSRDGSGLFWRVR
jgi:hypothetical protein